MVQWLPSVTRCHNAMIWSNCHRSLIDFWKWVNFFLTSGCGCHIHPKYSDRQTDRQTDWLTQTDRQTHRHIHWLTDTDRQTDTQTDWLTDWLTQTDRQTDRQTDWLTEGLFRRHDFVSLTKSYMILSCMIFLFRRHYNVMCDFFQQWRKLAGHLELSHHALHVLHCYS